jgi:hypothetical protein
MVNPTAETADTITRSLAAAQRYDAPYRHFYAEDLLPKALVEALARLPIAAPDPPRFLGRRDDQNAARCYVSAGTMRRFPAFRGLADALQSAPVVRAIAALCAAPLEGTRLRLECAVDRNGFWLAPHTDLGEKKFTCLISLGNARQSDLGTDIYGPRRRRCKRAPFRCNGALMFVPGAETWHGFEERPIEGLRRSLILNYVGPQWRARDQLTFPDQPVTLLE